MAARSDPIQNFSNKIKAYHEKEEEEQFYDFTIKDKEGAEINLTSFFSPPKLSTSPLCFAEMQIRVKLH